MTSESARAPAGLVALLADQVMAGLDALPVTVTEAAKGRLLHGLRVSIAGVGLPASVAVADAFSGEVGDCLVMGRRDGLPAPDAAFVNGVIAHSSLQEDCGSGGLQEGSHPGTYVVPAALAAVEDVGASGGDLIRALVAGYEVVSRIGAAAPHQIVTRRFRPVGVMGPFGAAAAATVAAGGDSEALATALSIAANMSSGSTQGVFDGSIEPYLHAGIAARNGLLAARLAMAGVSTSSHALEGEFGFFETYGGAAGDASTLLAGRKRWGIELVGSKKYAACLQNQETMALLADNVGDGFEADDVLSVVVRRPSHGSHGLNSPGVSRVPPFANMLHAQMSARFTAAVALVGGAGDDPSYFQRSFDDPTLTALASRIELQPTDAIDGIEVEIETVSRGRLTFSSEGTSSLFPSYELLRERFVSAVDPEGGGTGEKLAESIGRLEDQPDLGDFLSGLRGVSMSRWPANAV